jgi:hypothetical protein
MSHIESGDAKRFLRAEMVRRGVTYEDLAGMLDVIGVKESNKSLRSKLSRGSFTADFFLHALSAMGVTTLRLREPE